MEVIALLVFVSLALVSGAIFLFLWNVRSGAHEHIERLALLPLREDRVQESAPKADEAKGHKENS